MVVKKQTHSNNLQQLTAGTAQGKLMADEEASLGSHCIESFRGNRPRDGLQEKQGPFCALWWAAAPSVRRQQMPELTRSRDHPVAAC